MILDSIQNANRYAALHPLLGQAFEFLRTHDLASLPDGKITLDGERLYISVATAEGKSSAPLEAHQRYIDVQMPISTTETMGWRPTADCRAVQQPYDAERDIAFFADKYATNLQVQPGQFVIFFPEDAHAPAMARGLLKKLVVKILIK
jgi:biofilm protein TabA